MHIRIEPLADESPVVLPEPLGFGRVPTRRILTCRYEAGRGWADAEIGPRQHFVLDPAAQIFHCGQGIFEGTKAYLRPDGRINLFRPDANAARFNRSAARMAMPNFPEADFVTAIETLVALEHAWTPRTDAASLYIRPVMIATAPSKRSSSRSSSARNAGSGCTPSGVAANSTSVPSKSRNRL